MLRQDLMDSLKEELLTNPKNAVRTLQEDSKIVEALLNAEKERVKYVTMSENMERQLKENATKLKMTQGALLGVGLLFLLMLLEKK